MPPSLKDYSAAEQRLRQSIEQRCEGFPFHDYPSRGEDLETMRAYHNARGIPPAGFWGRLWWFLRGGGGIR